MAAYFPIKFEFPGLWLMNTTYQYQHCVCDVC